MSLHISDGRPPQDAQFQNLKSVSTLVASKLTAHEVNSNIVIAGEIVADAGSVNNLTVENLTVVNSNSLIPFPGFVALPLSVASLAGVAVYSAVAAPQIALPNVVADTASWSVYVPAAATQVRIYVPLKAALGSDTLVVSINGVSYPIAAAGSLKSQTSFVYYTAAFDWLSGAIMDVIISSSVASGGIEIGDAPYIGL